MCEKYGERVEKVWQKYDIINGVHVWTATHGFYEWRATHGELLMVVYKWLSTHGSYNGLLKMLRNYVDVYVGTMCDMVLMVEIYEKDMGFIIVKYYDDDI